MGLPKGRTNNPAGRKPGSQNKTTMEVKNLLLAFVSTNLDTLQADFNKLDSVQRLNFFEKVLKFVIPIQREEVTDLEKLSDEQLDRIIDELKKGSNGKSN